MSLHLNNRLFPLKVNAIYLYLILIMGLFGCTTTLPLSQTFYNSNKIGVVIEVSKIGMAKVGSQGLLDMALTPGDRFQEPLKSVEKQTKCKEQLQRDIANILTVCKKQFKIITDTIFIDEQPEFQGPDSKKKYAKDDWRFMKAKYNIDELMFVKLNYGLLVSYYGFIETGKQTYANVETEIVDLSDNSLLEKGKTKQVASIKGNWSEGKDYANLKNAIEDVYTKVINELRLKF